LIAFTTALELDNLHDLWIVDFGATDHMSKTLSNIFYLEQFASLTFVSVANGKGSHVKGKGKIKLISDKIMSDVICSLVSFPIALR